MPIGWTVEIPWTGREAKITIEFTVDGERALSVLQHLAVQPSRQFTMRRDGKMYGFSRSMLLEMVGVAVVSMFCSTRGAEAIPAFARQLDVKCTQCHTPVPPRLNNVGLAFRRMGFRLPDEEEGKLIFKGLPARGPFDTTSLITDFRANDRKSSPSQFELHEFELFSGGNLGKNGSYITEFEFEDGEWEWDMAEGQYNVGTPERSLIVRAGRIAPLLWEKGNHQRLTISRPLIFNQRVPAGSFPGFRLRDTLVGIEIGGAQHKLSEEGQLRSTFAALSIFNGVNAEGEPGSGDDNESKDIMAQIVHLWGESNTVGALWYHGTGLGEDDPATPADESSRDRFNRFVVAGNFRTPDGTDFVAGWMRGRESSSGVGGIGGVSSEGFYVEVDHSLAEKAVGVLRWDNFDPDTGVTGNTRRGLTLGMTYQPADNLLLRFEYQGHRTGDAPRTRDVTLQAMIVY